MRRRLFRRLVVLTAATVAITCAAGAAWAAMGSRERTNGLGRPGPARGAVTCGVFDATGNQTTVVKASELGDAAYWLRYGSGGNNASQVTFTVRPQFAGSPLAGQAQVFTNTGFDSITTPFGIPFWGGDLTSGPWQLKVSNDLAQSATCSFQVVP